MLKTYDIITVGDSGIDTLVKIHDASVHCTLNKEDCQLCIRYADKILADDMQTKTAYNAMNNAIGSARLGLKTAFYSMVGGDASGERIIKALAHDSVDTRYVKIDRQRKSNASVVINFQGERSILVYHEDFHYKLPPLPPARWCYLTTMGRRFPSLYRALARHVVRKKLKLSFNPGSFQLKAGRAALAPVLKATTVLFLNKEEARLLTKIDEERDIKELLRGMIKLGAKMAVITDGPKGSYAYDGEAAYFLRVFPAPIVERTGCGDSYGTAFTAALAYGKSMAEAMRWGTINSASVLQKIGPQDGLLSLSALKNTLRRHPRFQPKAL